LAGFNYQDFQITRLDLENYYGKVGNIATKLGFLSETHTSHYKCPECGATHLVEAIGDGNPVIIWGFAGRGRSVRWLGRLAGLRPAAVAR